MPDTIWRDVQRNEALCRLHDVGALRGAKPARSRRVLLEGSDSQHKNDQVRKGRHRSHSSILRQPSFI